MNKVFLLNTNIVSEFSKENPNPNVIAFYKVSRLPEGKRKDYISNCLKLYKDDLPIIPYDSFSAEICGNFTGTFEKKGHTLPYSDSQIAATAISNGMILVTHNTADFAPIAETNYLKMEDWFEA